MLWRKFREISLCSMKEISPKNKQEAPLPVVYFPRWQLCDNNDVLDMWRHLTLCLMSNPGVSLPRRSSIWHSVTSRFLLLWCGDNCDRRSPKFTQTDACWAFKATTRCLALQHQGQKVIFFNLSSRGYFSMLVVGCQVYAGKVPPSDGFRTNHRFCARKSVWSFWHTNILVLALS